jgi:hypothetical protein
MTMTLTDGEKLIFAAEYSRAHARALHALQDVLSMDVPVSSTRMMVGRSVDVVLDWQNTLSQALGWAFEEAYDSAPDFSLNWIKRYALIEAANVISVLRTQAESVAGLFESKDPSQPEWREVLSQIFDITPP